VENIILIKLKIESSGADWSDRHDGHLSDGKNDFKSIFNSWFQRDVSVTFCDKNRSARNQFVIGEIVYVMIEFKNNAESTA